MIHALVDDCPYMVVRKGIYDAFSAPLEADQFCLLENFQLMGYGRYRHAQGGGYVAHAHRFLKEHIEYLYSGAVAEYLEQLCQIVQLVFLRDGFVYNLQKIFMDLTAITDFHFFIYVFFHSEYLDIIIKDFSQTKYGLH